MLFAIAFYLNSLGNFALGIVLGALLGPAEFGGYATVALAGVTLAAATLDWLRFSALRYFSDPTTRADTASSLEAGYLYVVALVMALTLGLGLCGLTFGLSRPLFFMIPALAFALNRVDYAGAKFRASDRPHPFIWLFGLRQALYFTLTVGFAYVTRSAVATAGALAVSSLIAALALSPALRTPGAHWRRGRAQDLTVYLRYAKPIVASLVIYQIVWLINRHAALETLGPAITGKFSLASDVGQKLFMAVNSLPDFLLFQRVLRRDREEGRAAAWREVASNFTLMFALIAALTAGYVAMAPTFEAILVPVAYRGDFARLTLELAPGFCALSLIVSGVNPVFQLASRTLPLSVAAVIALGFNFAALALTPATQSIDTLACVNSLAFVVALVIVGAWAFRCAEAHPRLRDLVVVVVAATAMGFALRPLNGLGAPAVSAVLALAGGGAFYAGALIVFDIGGMRAIARAALQSAPALRARLAFGLR